MLSPASAKSRSLRNISMPVTTDFLLSSVQADDFDFVRHLQNATLNSTGSNSATAGDGEDVLNRHQERLVSLTFRGRDVVVNSVHQVEDALVLRSVDVLGLAGECRAFKRNP